MAERVFNLPDLGEGLEDAEIVEWKVAEGDTVSLNQPLVEVNTAKALVEIPSPVAGVVTSLHGQAGDVVNVGAPLVTFSVEGEAPAREAAPEPAEEGSKRQAVLVGYGVGDAPAGERRRPRLTPPGPRQAPAAAAEGAAAPEGTGQTATPGVSGGARATPVVRKLARERGINLATVAGTGPDGRITRDDVLKAAGPAEAASVTGGVAAGTGGAATVTSSPAEPQPDEAMPRGTGAVEPAPAAQASGTEERIPVRGARRLIAQKMTRSWQEIPQVTSFHSVDATQVDALRRELSTEGARVSSLAVIVRALVEICRDHPMLNSSFDGEAGEIVVRRSYHVGIAADTERGLLVPVVRDVDRKGISEVAREMAEVVEAARSGRATPEQLTGSTITVSNYGVFGSDAGTPIINHPEAAILGVGRIVPRPMVVDGRIEARTAVTLALTFDHRIMDGADADRAMTALRELLESPFRLGGLPR
ncbi:MAG TPA: dihydrolipoamide acetyltransferase family protein [Actinomycetota bacterium]|jgi:pyruvate dehydrogenase E2 component (dihydrolipoamide acetyltransferase)|nr:dihydrolipoamide acetyltransferase family protein [Actinomycetota bacterium]